MPDGRTLREIGSARMREGRFAEAVDALTLAVEQDSDDEPAWRLLGGALASLGDADGAAAAFAQAATLRPDIAKNHYNLGLALQRIGRADEARARYAQALAIDPNYAQAQARLTEMAPPLAPTPPPLPETPEPTPPQAQIERPARTYDAPPPALGRRPTPSPAPTTNGSAGTIRTLGIVGLAGGLLCFLPFLLSPIAWAMGNNALKALDAQPDADRRLRSQINEGRVLGIVGTVLLALGIGVIVVLIVLLRSFS